MSTILDVSIRDSYAFSKETLEFSKVEALIRKMYSIGITHFEVGYFNEKILNKTNNFILSGSQEYYEFINNLKKDLNLKTFVMVHPNECLKDSSLDYLANSGFDSLRVIYKKDCKELIKNYISVCSKKNIKVCLNLTRCSEKNQNEIDDFIFFCNEFSPNVVYFADSNSALQPKDVKFIFEDCITKISSNVELGFHAHDGMSCALLNSVEALKLGVKYIDASCLPYGRAGKHNLNIIKFIHYLLREKRYNKDFMPSQLIDTYSDILSIFNINDNSMLCFLEGLYNRNLDFIEKIDGYDLKQKLKIITNI